MSENRLKKKILIISHDKIGSSMAGPGIRYHNMAQVLNESFDVTIGFFDKTYLPDKSLKHTYRVRHVDAYYFEEGFKEIDIVISHLLTPPMIKYCNDLGVFMVFDLYVPGPTENLAVNLFSGEKPKPEDDVAYDYSLEMYQVFLEYGDLFLVSNQRQLDFWVGYAFGAGTIHLSSYAKRPVYDRFIYASMGLNLKTPLKHTSHVMKGQIPGIKKTDKVLVWTGGIWGHFDGQVLVRAMKGLSKNHPEIKLVVLGTQHPNSSIPEMKESLDTRKLADELGLIGKNIFFRDGWLGYQERINYFLEADAAINTHKESIETEFSHRTRVLDHLLFGLPTISTKGDYISDAVISPNGLGIVVPPYDIVALQKAIMQILTPKVKAEIKERIEEIKPFFDWHETLKELNDILLKDPEKLPVLNIAHNLRSTTTIHRLARKFTPVAIKKIIVRSMRLVGLR